MRCWAQGFVQLQNGGRAGTLWFCGSRCVLVNIAAAFPASSFPSCHSHLGSTELPSKEFICVLTRVILVGVTIKMPVLVFVELHSWRGAGAQLCFSCRLKARLR